MKINWQPDHLENDFVKILPLSESDFEEVYSAASDPLIWEQHPASDRYKREVFQNYFDEAMNTGTGFKIIEKTSGEVIGSTRFYEYKPEDSSIMIGYTFLARKYWGGKYNPSIKKLLLDHAFQYVDKVIFQVGGGNIRSQKAIEKLGAKKEGESTLNLNGKVILHQEFVLLKENWDRNNF
jgi:RimJ/RimL family protein N-acetyltransferase